MLLELLIAKIRHWMAEIGRSKTYSFHLPSGVEDEIRLIHLM